MAWGCLRRRACGSFSDLTVKDVLVLFFPCWWTVLACCCFCYYAVHPAIHHGLPKTIPMYWSLISSFPAAVTAFNYYIFQRDAVVELGLTRFTIAELSQVMRLWGVLIIGAFLILATVCGIQFSECRTCDHENFAENIFWCIATLTWMALMACCAPSSKHLSKLSYTQETSTGGPQNVGRVFGRVAMTDDARFMVDAQDSAPDNFIRAGVHPDLIAQGKVATKTGE
ncbi:hypothetical protein Emed_003389 [Eimeria media]